MGCNTSSEAKQGNEGKENANAQENNANAATGKLFFMKF